MEKHGVSSLPLPGWKPTWQDPKEESSQQWFATIKATDGKALMPPPFWNASWMYGEYQKWLRIETAPGTPLTWVLYPYRRGTEPPELTRLTDGVRVSAGKQTDEIRFDGDDVTLLRNGKLTPLRRDAQRQRDK